MTVPITTPSASSASTPEPETPAQLEHLQIAVSGELSCAPWRVKNYLHMKFGDMHMDVNDKETGERLGYVSGCVGGGIELHDERSGCTWSINFRDLWFAFQAALETQREQLARMPSTPKQ